MDKVPALGEARKLLNGANGRSLNGNGHHRKLVKPKDNEPPDVDVGRFLDLIKNPGMKTLAQSIINSVNRSRSGELEVDQVRVEMSAYSRLLQVLAADRALGDK